MFWGKNMSNNGVFSIIVVPMLTASKFELYFFAIIKVLIFCELHKLRSLFFIPILC